MKEWEMKWDPGDPDINMNNTEYIKVGDKK